MKPVSGGARGGGQYLRHKSGRSHPFVSVLTQGGRKIIITTVCPPPPQQFLFPPRGGGASAAPETG